MAAMARRFAAATFSRTSLSEATDDIMSSWLRHFSGRRSSSPPSSSGAWDSEVASTHGHRHRSSADGRHARPASPVPSTVSNSGSDSLLTTSVSSEGSSEGPAPAEVAWGSTLCLALMALTATLAVVAVALGATHIVATGDLSIADRGQDHVDAPQVIQSEKQRTGSHTVAPSAILPKGDAFESESDGATTFGAPVAFTPTVEDVFAVAKRKSTADPLGADNERSPCDGVFYTYCARAPPQFLYDARSQTCIESGEDEVELCNHSPNRFATKADCARSCVHGFAQADRCFDTPVFAKCTRHDVKVKQWYFTGSTCASWPFLRGRCPGNETRTFATFADCLQRCVTGAKEGKRPCEPLDTGNARTCSLQELSYPYFADSVGDRVRCLAASVAGLARHRCLAGTNRFATKAACHRACVQGSDDGVLELGWY
ncbi:uncharacterized protein [Dermacentor albipictus]|uniref:uncharacterized protein isoform X2 n=1 Tax=Dermacentor albipictus TaxID=60249 RepID=UPI0031FD75B6